MRRRFWYDTEFIERPGSIDLISIGVVGEDDSEYYAISTEFDEKLALSDPWLKENVLAHLPPRTDPLWKPRSVIKNDLLDFFKPSESDRVELWGYFADYDHVVLCWLFGRMIDLPKGMPMFTRDLVQLREAMGWPELPKQTSTAHHALADARWIKEAWSYLAYTY